jgi:serine/threonine-protein kinase
MPGFRLEPAALIGRVLDDRYELIEFIAQGGMGLVFRARQLSVDRAVAVKLLLNMEDDAVRRFENEARIVSSLKSPHTVRLIDFGRSNGELYLVTELLDGQTLASILSSGPMAVQRVLELASQLCDSLIEAHEKGIVHRDLKPDNIFLQTVSGREVAKILDFGIARLLEAPSHNTTGFIGTPAYASPEQVLGEPVDPRSDLYSLGVVLHECLSGSVPFKARGTVPLMTKQAYESPPLLPEEVPKDVAGLIGDLLAKAPGDRPLSARAVRSEIDWLLSGGVLSVPTQTRAPLTPRSERDPPPPKRSSRSRFLGPALVLAALVFAGLLYLASMGGGAQSIAPPAIEVPKTIEPPSNPEPLHEQDESVKTKAKRRRSTRDPNDDLFDPETGLLRPGSR